MRKCGPVRELANEPDKDKQVVDVRHKLAKKQDAREAL